MATIGSSGPIERRVASRTNRMAMKPITRSI